MYATKEQEFVIRFFDQLHTKILEHDLVYGISVPENREHVLLLI